MHSCMQCGLHFCNPPNWAWALNSALKCTLPDIHRKPPSSIGHPLPWTWLTDWLSIHSVVSTPPPASESITAIKSLGLAFISVISKVDGIIIIRCGCDGWMGSACLPVVDKVVIVYVAVLHNEWRPSLPWWLTYYCSYASRFDCLWLQTGAFAMHRLNITKPCPVGHLMI